MVGFGVDCNAPRPPFILAKLVWRNGLRAIIHPLWLVLQIVVRFFASVFGFGAGVFGHSGDRGSAANWVFKPGIVQGEDVPGMDADEYL